MPAPARQPAPATAGQVHAHRFSLRRLQSALVRREPVPGRGGGDPLRTQARAQVAGALVAVLVLGGFAVWGLVTRAPDWREAPLVVGASSGATYVVVDRQRLLPVPNLATARLLLTGPGGTGAPVEVPEARLAGVPRLPPVGIPDAPALPPPTGPDTAPAVWSVCDTAAPEGSPPPGVSPWARPGLWSTVLADAAEPGTALGAGSGLLLRDRLGGTWLAHDGVRSRLDPADRPVVLTLGLDGALPRPVSTGLLNALPEAPPLVSPVVPGRGTPSRRDLAGEPVGGVVRVANPSQPDTFYVVTTDGVQVVSSLVAELLRRSDPTRAGVEVPFVPPNSLPSDRSRVVPDGVYPDRAPVLVPASEAVTACASSRGGDPRPGLRLVAGPPSAAPTVTLAAADGSGDGVDAAAVPGAGVTVRAVPSGRAELPGALAVVSGSGRVSSVPDPATAGILGLGTTFPSAPDAVVGLLPAGPALTAAAAREPLVG